MGAGEHGDLRGGLGREVWCRGEERTAVDKEGMEKFKVRARAEGAANDETGAMQSEGRQEQSAKNGVVDRPQQEPSPELERELERSANHDHGRKVNTRRPHRGK